MKVLHYINNLGSGGAEKLLSDILPALKDKGLVVEVMLANSAANVDKYTSALKRHGIKITSQDVSFYNPLQIWNLIKYINRNNFDTVHAHLFPTQYWLAFASCFLKSKIKLVKTEHSVFNERKNYKLLRPLEKFVYNRYDRIIAITENVKANLENWIGRTDIITIANGVNLSQIEVEQQIPDEKEYQFLEAGNFNILMVGRFDGWQKDQLTLVKALNFLPKNCCVYFAGEGHFRLKVEKYCLEHDLLDQVVFLGLRQDIYRLMHRVNLNVLSTNHEGLSGVVLESLASHRPFLGSDVVGVQEIVPDNRFLFPAGNAQKLAEQIAEISQSEELRQNMAETAVKFVQGFDIKYMVDNYVEVYRSLTEKNNDH